LTPNGCDVKRDLGSLHLAKTAIKPLPYGRGTGIANPIDVHVGKRIRMRRLLLDMTQETLANALGLTFQQIQKYEHGANRVSASRLSATADILGVPISFFFDGLTPGTPEETASRERLEQPETIEFIRLYYAIPDQHVRQQFLDLVKAVAARTPVAEVALPRARMPHRRGRPARYPRIGHR
jgi:transcriptional regulator with XRE-family HTH domain